MVPTVLQSPEMSWIFKNVLDCAIIVQKYFNLTLIVPEFFHMLCVPTLQRSVLI